MAAARLCWEASLTDKAAKWSTDKGKQEEAELALAAAIKKRMGFEDEAEFRECRRLGFPTKAEYDECKLLGFEMSFEGKDEFIFVYKRLGFESKADFDAYKRNGDFEALKGLGCGSKAEFDECRASGDLEQLKGMGFKKKSDFDECRRKGFGTKAEYDEAKKADKAREKQEAAAAEAAVREAAKARLAEGYTEAKLKHTNIRESEILDKVKKEEVWEQVKASPTTMTPEQLALLKAARQALADEYLALPKEEQEAMQFQQYCLWTDDKYYASLNAALADGTTALLRADFLERLAAEGRPLGHRAELPPEAFYEGPIWAEEGDYPDYVHSGVIIVGLSYMWATADHPDPDGEQLRDVAKYLRWLQEAGGHHEGKLVAVFWDWASLYQDKPFFDPRRTEEQTRMFKSGLQNVNLWYCHPNTLTLMNRKTPAGRQWSYDDSGWPVSVRKMMGLVGGHFRLCAARSLSYFLLSLLCHDGCVCSFLFLFPSDATTTTTQLHRMQLFERAVSQFVKDKRGVMDLHSVLETLADEKVRDVVKNEFYHMAKACGERFKPAPPLAPVAMSLKLAVAHFTNGADVAFVQGKYEATFLLVLGKAKQLSFTFMDWVTEEQWAAFCLEVLPQCASLEELNLTGNANLKVDIVELVAKLPPTLKTLRLGNTGCVGDAGKADWARLPALERVYLMHTKVTGSEEDLKAAGCAAGYIGI